MALETYDLDHVDLLASSFERLLGRKLISGEFASSAERAKVLYEAPFCLLSHGTEDVPIFNYGNLAAQQAFELSWDELTRMESRKSAEAITQEERDELLSRVTKFGFIDDYKGIRVSSTGQRFMIEDAIVWNLIDEQGVYRGQAAALFKWYML